MAYTKLSAAVVGKKYRSAIAAYRRQLSDGSLRLSFEQEADAYFRRCALGIWAAGGGELTDNHVDAYNAICSGTNRPAQVLYLELCAAVSTAPDFQPPGFFSQLMAADRGAGRDRTGQFCELSQLVFLLLAAVYDGLNTAAADCARAYAERLRQAAGQPPRAPRSPGDDGAPDHSGAAKNAADASAQDGTDAKAEQEAQPEEPQPTLEELMEELDSLCGLEKVKKDVRSLVNLVKIRKLREEQELPVPAMSLHLVFMGNPGTGKTTVARLLAGIYRAIGVLPKGQLVEVDRSGLVAGYVGQTAIQTQKVLQSAMGGVLFIDEAYSLASQPGSNDFGQEAIDTILKAMEDHRKDLVVIVAGYSNLMMKFIHSNPGLESRFNKYIYFDDYTGPELESIFLSVCRKNGYQVEDPLKERLPAFFQTLYDERDENFGNAREVRNLFEKLVSIQSDRVAQLEQPTREDLMTITCAAVDPAAQEDA
ncbi:MAG: AAA family ATPase [Clostridiales bacterium]|nr:AAA family ATPase [Clostridiales bacterium]